MNQTPNIYKRYTSQIRHNTIVLLKQQQLSHIHQRYEQKIQSLAEKNILNDALIFKSSDKNMEPLALKKFQDYFKKNTEPVRNMKIFNKIIQTTTSIKPNKHQRYLPLTSRIANKVIERDSKIGQKSNQKDRRTAVYTSNSNVQRFILTQGKQKIKNVFDEKDQNKQSALTSSPMNPSLGHNKKRQRLNNSIDLSKLLNKTFSDNHKQTINNEMYLLNKDFQQGDLKNTSYLKIDRSVLVSRKTMSTQIHTDDGRQFPKEEELKKAIRAKMINRKKVLEQSYNQKIRSRSPSPVKYPRRMNFFTYLNPTSKQEFALNDLLKVCVTNSQIDEVRLNMNSCFFSVYVQDGNNSELIKSIIRGISGWRVAELPSVANLVWTQSYRRNLVDKKPKKIIKNQIIQQDNELSRSRQKIISKDKNSPNFLVSRRLKNNCRNSGSSKFLKKRSPSRSSSQSSQRQRRPDADNNCPELSLNKNMSQEKYLYQNQVKRLLPLKFSVQNFVLKNQKQFKKVAITPNFLIHNHLIGHRAISDKKNLLFNLRKYYYSLSINPFDFIPETHDICSLQDEFLHKQNQTYVKFNKDNAMQKQTWIVKPGQDSNRGRGIIICKGWEQVSKQIQKRLKQQNTKNNIVQVKTLPQSSKQLSPSPQKLDIPNKHKRAQRTLILQRYIVPLLYNGRKFDIRSYMLVTWVNNVLNGYVYEECYIRTSSKQFDLQSTNKYVHLTNDAIQCMSHQYGKYEEGNKVSQSNFCRYFNSQSRNTDKSWKQIKEEMSLQCQDILKSSSKKLVGKFGLRQSLIKQNYGYGLDSNLLQRRSESISPEKNNDKIPSLFTCNNAVQKQTQMSFELFGLDFMIDSDSKLWLIEVNTNPSLSHDCSRVLSRLIPKLLENTLAVSVMPYMRPSRISQTNLYNNLYTHIYQEVIQD